jgi:4-amino-4-deoxy-L-arabinose transferase-like glycosyltransferase
MILLGFLVYVLAIRITDMHSDEYLVYFQTRLDLAYTFWHQTYNDVHPPLWFSFFWGWRQLVGVSEFAGRLHAILFTLMTLALLYQLGREGFGRRTVGLLAMALLIASGYHVAYALEIRPYALTMLLATLSMLWFGRWLRSGRHRWALLWGGLAGVMMYIHYFTAFLFTAQVLFALLTKRPVRQMLGGVIRAILTAAAIWLPWFPLFIGQVLTLRRLAAEAGTDYGTGLGTNVTTAATSPETINRLLTLMTNGQWLLYALLLLLGIWLLRKQRALWLALTWAFGVPALALLVNIAAAVFTPRYYAYLTPGLALAAAAGIATLAAQAQQARRLVYSLAVLAVLLIGIAMPPTLPVRAPLRDIFREMSAQYREGTAYAYPTGAFVDGWLEWQMQQYMTPPLYEARLSSLEGDLPRRVWFVSAAWFNDVVQAEFRALEQTHPLQTVLGDCTRAWCFLAQLMEAPPQQAAQVFGEQIGFLGADVDEAGRDSIALRLWWRADATVPLDYSIGVQMLNSSGALVAQSDGPIQHYGTEVVQTSAMQPGKLYIDWRTLTPSVPLPPGDYTLHVIVYQSWDGVRLTLDGDADSFVLPALVVN